MERILNDSTDRIVFFVARDVVDLFTRETGLSSFTVDYVLDNGSRAQITSPTTAEIDNTNLPGLYSLAIDEGGMTNMDAANDEETLVLHVTHASMTPVTKRVSVYRDMFVENNLDHLMKVAVADRDTLAEVVDDTVLANLMTKTNGDTSDFDHATMSLESLNTDLDNLILETDLVISSGTVGTVTSTTVFVITDASASAVNDHYNQHFITVYDDSLGTYQTRVIQDYVGASKTVTLRNALTFTPVITNDTFRIWAMAFSDEAVAGGTTTTYEVNSTGESGGTGLQGVYVWVTTDSTGNHIIASGVTDSDGKVDFMLTSGSTYYVWKRLAGYTFDDNPETIEAT